jgi:hypothetical protein
LSHLLVFSSCFQYVEGKPLGELQPFQLDDMRFLMSRESQTEPPQYFLWTVKTDTWQQITDFPHPYPQVSLEAVLCLTLFAYSHTTQ